MIKDVFYFGELGYFMHILGAIEYYLLNHPDTNLSICTYKTFYDILKILFGSRIHLWDIVALHSDRGFHNCKYYDENIKDISLNERPSEIDKILDGKQIGRVRIVYD